MPFRLRERKSRVQVKNVGHDKETIPKRERNLEMRSEPHLDCRSRWPFGQ